MLEYGLRRTLPSRLQEPLGIVCLLFNQLAPCKVFYAIADLFASSCMQITLYFADFNATCEGERIFNVMINGQTVVTGVDVYALGGGDNSAVSVASPAFYSSSRSSFDIALPTVVSLHMTNAMPIPSICTRRYLKQLLFVLLQQ